MLGVLFYHNYGSSNIFSLILITYLKTNTATQLILLIDFKLPTFEAIIFRFLNFKILIDYVIFFCFKRHLLNFSISILFAGSLQSLTKAVFYKQLIPISKILGQYLLKGLTSA